MKTNSTWMDFVKKKAKGLLIPYISFSFVSMAVYELMVAFLGIEEKLKFPRDLFVVLYGNSQSDIMKWNTPLWFLPCLFAVSLIIYLLEKVINKIFFLGGQRLRILTIIVFLAGSMCWHGVFDLKLPFQMESGLFMIGFCELGVLV